MTIAMVFFFFIRAGEIQFTSRRMRCNAINDAGIFKLIDPRPMQLKHTNADGFIKFSTCGFICSFLRVYFVLWDTARDTLCEQKVTLSDDMRSFLLLFHFSLKLLTQFYWNSFFSFYFLRTKKKKWFSLKLFINDLCFLLLEGLHCFELIYSYLTFRLMSRTCFENSNFRLFYSCATLSFHKPWTFFLFSWLRHYIPLSQVSIHFVPVCLVNLAPISNYVLSILHRRQRRVIVDLWKLASVIDISAQPALFSPDVL